MNYFFADENNQPVGPHTLDELKAMVASGKLQPTSYIIEEGGSEWKELSSILGAAKPAAASVSSDQDKISINISKTETTEAAKNFLANTGEQMPVWKMVLLLVCCFPLGYMAMGQTVKGWVLYLAALLTGFVGIVALVDYIFCWQATKSRKLGEWEFFPKP